MMMPRMKIRKSKGPLGGWRIDVTTFIDKNRYATFDLALASVIRRQRTRAVANLIDDLTNHTPRGEYVGIRGDLVAGKDHASKYSTLYMRFTELGHPVYIRYDDDESGQRDYYVALWREK